MTGGRQWIFYVLTRGMEAGMEGGVTLAKGFGRKGGGGNLGEALSGKPALLILLDASVQLNGKTYCLESQLCWSSSIDSCTGRCTGTPSKDTMSAIPPILSDTIQPMHRIQIVFWLRHKQYGFHKLLWDICTTSEILVTFPPCILQLQFYPFFVWSLDFASQERLLPNFSSLHGILIPCFSQSKLHIKRKQLKLHIKRKQSRLHIKRKQSRLHIKRKQSKLQHIKRKQSEAAYQKKTIVAAY